MHQIFDVITIKYLEYLKPRSKEEFHQNMGLVFHCVLVHFLRKYYCLYRNHEFVSQYNKIASLN